MSAPTEDAVREALGRVIDPELRRSITDLGMVESIEISEAGAVTVGVLLTVAGCPLKDTITADARREVGGVEGVTEVQVRLGVMSDEQRAGLRTRLRGGAAEPVIPFTQPGSLTRVYAVTSGKGGVGKSSVTANLAAAIATQGLNVGVVDADIYGFSIPRMLGVDRVPTQLDGMIVPPVAHGVKVISIGMFVESKQPVVWRGPMLHRAVQQFLSDVFWGDLDVLLLDLPPGTGDVTISVAQLLPNAEILVVTTPQTAAAEVAERTGLIAAQTKQKVVGVIENMSYMPQPDGSRLEIFGSGGGRTVSDSLTRTLGYDVPLLAQLPLDIRLREGSDGGVPAAVAEDGRPAADAPAALELASVARRLAHRSRGLAGRRLSLKVAT
ncbi:Mrp/NBP35 family ATP-binding protein [Actinomyces israelii]|uniref:Iron-sulfur cluster carrier protein n=1 Tax=Actinomyces israelii TaxID=1659 RepID=A0ABT4IBZ9_9ACTO|nr:Mrp/NBP35 family ATP-binding protein [Actinomyces israelii]MCZ0859051.1 Mrp/NBP35 family ATP-binding protein [Actinomyces israelii]